MSTDQSLRYRWWCAYCDCYSEETFETNRSAHQAGVEHISDAGHGLTTIRTPTVD